ncbi:hypothetical protein Vadar_004021 [Vaccinium darrowii]|uniref:Uncharacterized protein n=1 Tax=Vaccinium darrowii TaxID=229202 RepID=A0ACB7YTZ2_9ERIC|nr:hypothetical protein Vadar_004021 [Vaccinium darrowii]
MSSSENYAAILSKLRDEGIPFEPDNESKLLPITPVELWLALGLAAGNGDVRRALVAEDEKPTGFEGGLLLLLLLMACDI